MSATEYAKNLPVRGNITSGMSRILDMPRVSVYRTGAATPGNATLTLFGWDALEYQSEGMWNTTNPTRITCITAGLYAFVAWNAWASAGTDYRRIYLQRTTAAGAVTVYNDAVYPTVTGAVSSQHTTAQIELDAGDYVETVVQQTTGGGLAIQPSTLAQRWNGMQACLIST